MQIIIINGAPGSGKTTISKKLHEYYKSPWFEFGWIPEFRNLNPHTEMSYEDEEKMTFETLALVTKNYVRHGFENIILSDLNDSRMWDIPNVFKDFDYIAFTFFTEDEFLIKERILSRNNGNTYKNWEEAIKINKDISQRPILMNEYRIRIDRKTPDEIMRYIIMTIDTYKPRLETLKSVLTKMLGKNIIDADYQTTKLHGGTVGNVQLITGIAETADGEKLPYKVVLKIQNKWERYNNPDSWRREYDLYASDFKTIFDDSFSWAECYHAEINEDETQTQLWLEYIDGLSGSNLTVDMLEKAAFELGRFQGRLYKEKPDMLQNISCFTDQKWSAEYLKELFEKLYGYFCSADCAITEQLKILTGFADNIEKLPVVLCQHDFWSTNIFCSEDNKIISIDWDCAGWGYMGEDIVQLVTDHTKPEYLAEYCRRFVPSYLKGIAEYIEIQNNWETLIIKFIGYIIINDYIHTESQDKKNQLITELQKICDIIKTNKT